MNRFLIAASLATSFALTGSTFAEDAKPKAKAEKAEAKAPAQPGAVKQQGYSDTPIIPGTQWHVHDPARPQAPVVTPGNATRGETVGTAPSDAIVLFDGKDLSQWSTDKGSEAPWKVENGYFEVVPKTGYIRTRQEFSDFQLHIEFQAPAEVKGDGQGRGNSGIFLVGEIEVQVLDSYNNPASYADGHAGSVYGQYPPLVNASLPPGQWQTYDILFTAPKFDGDKLVKPAYVTVLHNGVVVQNHTEVQGKTAHKALAKYFPSMAKGPIKLQDHGNPVRYRNIWVRPLN